MVIYIWKTAYGVDWAYSWDMANVPKDARAVNLDTWFDYNLNELEVLACLEALEE